MKSARIAVRLPDALIRRARERRAALDLRRLDPSIHVVVA